jgi:hypothetical protein
MKNVIKVWGQTFISADLRNLKAVWAEPGSMKASRREPETCLGRVFNYKLGCFDDVHVLIMWMHTHMYS